MKKKLQGKNLPPSHQTENKVRMVLREKVYLLKGKEDEKPATEPSELLSQGINFFSGLAKTLSSPQETQKLVHSITEKDEKSGQMYLNIPVESQETVSQVFNMLGQFLQKGQ